MINLEQIKTILERGVEEIIDGDNLKKKLLSGQQLRVKFGIDPTSPNIHIGRSVPLLKLRDFQEAGHKIVFIIGDFTGVIGDTSDKDSERPMLSRKKIEENMTGYVDQAGKILDMSACEIHYNSEWLDKLKYFEICEQANIFSLAEFIAREKIRLRLNAGTRISLREIMYPLMQGYDSVAIKADVEIGGTDQRFNLLAGRSMQQHYGQAPQDIVMGPIINGTDGRKMSSSWGNTVNISASPDDIFGKIMSIVDEQIISYFKLLTRASTLEVAEYEKSLAAGENPKNIKILLAHELTRMYHGVDAANLARENFINLFSKREIPSEIKQFKPKSYDIISVLVESKLCPSKSEARRLIDGGGVKINNEKVFDLNSQLSSGDVLQKGSRVFIKII